MVEGIADTPDNLEVRFRITRRLAVRIAALAGFGFQVTPALLEDVGRKKVLEKLFLSDEIFQAAKEGTQSLRKLLGSMKDLEFIESGGGGIVALSEEILAERILPPAISTRGAPVHRPGGTPAEQLPLLNELLMGTPLGDQDLRNEKIRFLTSSSWEERLEALRRIVLVPLPPSDKAGVLFFALRDDDHRIISEAVKAFKEIGLSPQIADSIIELIRGDASARNQALQWLVQKASRIERHESDILVAVTARLIRDEEFDSLKSLLLKLLRAHMRGRETSPAEVREMVRILTRNVSPQQEDAQLTLRDLLLSIAKGSTAILCDALWEEIEGLPFGSHRTFLIGLLGRLESRKAGLDKLDRVLLEEEIPGSLERGQDLSAYRYVLHRRYRELFPSLLSASQQEGEERKALVFRILGETLPGTELKPGAKAHRVKALLALAERSGKTVRRAFLRTGLHQIEGLPGTFGKRFTSLFMSVLESEFFPERNQEVWYAIRDVGWPSVPALTDYITEEANDPRLRKECLAILRDFIAEEVKYPAKRKDLQFLLDWLESDGVSLDFTLRNEVTPLIGMILLHSMLSRKQTMRLASELVKRLRGEYTPGDVGALPYLARSPRVGAELKRKMIRRLIRVLEEGAETRVASEKTGEDGVILEIENGTPIHTQQLPSALSALKEAALALAPEDPGMTYMIARTLMRKWEEIVKWETVWGISSRAELLKTLGEMTRSRAVSPPLAAEIFLFLTQHFFSVPHELHLAEIVTIPIHEGCFPNIGAIATRILRVLLELAHDSESVGPDEVGRYLLAAARVVASPDSPARDTKGRSLAALLLDLLEKRINLGFEEDGEALRILAETTVLPKAMRERAATVSALHIPRETLEDGTMDI
ncbi:MAG: hypothetical protein ACYTFG_11415 [Planctomycetota bacterium]